MFDFKLNRKKVRKHYTKTKFERKYGRLSRQTPCLRRPRYLLRSFLSVFEPISWLPAGNGELLLYWQLSFSKGKAVKKTEQDEEQFVVLSDVAEAVLRRRRERRRLFSRLLTKTRKETKTSMLQQKKKIPTHLFVVVLQSNFQRVVGFLPTVNQHKPR